MSKKEKMYRVNCTVEMVEKIKSYIKERRYDYNSDIILILSKAVINVMITSASGICYNPSKHKKFSFDEMKKIEKILNLEKSHTKIYKTRNGSYSLEPICNNGRYCEEKLCSVAGIYSIPEEFKIILPSGRIRFENNIYLIDNKGEPAIGMYKFENGVSRLENIVALKRIYLD